MAKVGSNFLNHQGDSGQGFPLDLGETGGTKFELCQQCSS